MKEFKKFIGMTLEDAEKELYPMAARMGLSISCISSQEGFFNIDVDPKRLNVDIAKNGKIIKFTRG